MERKNSTYYYLSALEAYDQADSDAGRDKAAALRYYIADLYLEEGNEDGALRYFRELGDYADAPARIQGIFYQRGERAIAEGNLRSAEADFRQAGDYLDAPERLAQVYYAQAETMLSQQKEEDAIIAFQKAGEYRDAKEQFETLFAARTENLIAAGDFVNAENMLLLLGDSEGYLALRYQHAVSLYEAGDLAGAAEFFAGINICPRRMAAPLRNTWRRSPHQRPLLLTESNMGRHGFFDKRPQ